MGSIFSPEPSSSYADDPSDDGYDDVHRRQQYYSTSYFQKIIKTAIHKWLVRHIGQIRSSRNPRYKTFRVHHEFIVPLRDDVLSAFDRSRFHRKFKRTLMSNLQINAWEECRRYRFANFSLQLVREGSRYTVNACVDYYRRGEQVNPTPPSNAVDMTCKICMDRAIEVVFIPCGHLVACSTCAKQDICPLCRTPIQKRQRIYST